MNEQIYFLWDYNWCIGTLVSSGPKNNKIRFEDFGYLPHVKTVSKEKCAVPGESVCVVWEQWKGKNGRGGYRVERELYPQHRVPAERVARQLGDGRVTEVSYGVEE